MATKPLDDLQKRAAAILGMKLESIGKTQARQNFFPIVDALGQTSSAVEITDHEEPVAMLLSYSHWLALVSKMAMLSKKDGSAPQPNLMGSIQIVGDLGTGSKKAADQFAQSIKKTIEKL